MPVTFVDRTVRVFSFILKYLSDKMSFPISYKYVGKLL